MHFRCRAAARQVQAKAKAHDAECRVSAQWRRRSWWWARLPPQYARLHLPFNEADRLTEGANTPVLSGFSGSMAEYGITPLRQLMLWFMQENQDSLQECNATSNRKTIICVLRHTLAFFIYRVQYSCIGKVSFYPCMADAPCCPHFQMLSENGETSISSEDDSTLSAGRREFPYGL